MQINSLVLKTLKFLYDPLQSNMKIKFSRNDWNNINSSWVDSNNDKNRFLFKKWIWMKEKWVTKNPLFLYSPMSISEIEQFFHPQEKYYFKLSTKETKSFPFVFMYQHS